MKKKGREEKRREKQMLLWEEKSDVKLERVRICGCGFEKEEAE